MTVPRYVLKKPSPDFQWEIWDAIENCKIRVETAAERYYKMKAWCEKMNAEESAKPSEEP